MNISEAKAEMKLADKVCFLFVLYRGLLIGRSSKVEGIEEKEEGANQEK